jgi:ABC-type glycerol-3-phosphate transport system substrate-binding protein
MQRFLSLFLAICLLTACSGIGGGDVLPTIGPGPNGGGSTDGQVTISFAVYEYERPQYESLIERFRSENPSINVVLVNAEEIYNFDGSDVTQHQILRQMASKADTFSTNTLYLSDDLYDSPLLLDLRPLMDADASFQRSDFYPGVLESSIRNNRIVVLPQYFHLQALGYNKNLFAQAGIAEPAYDWTWNDLLGIAQAIGTPGNINPTYGYHDADGGLSTLDAILRQRDYNLFTTDPSQIRLDSEVFVEAIEQVRQLNSSNAIFSEMAVSEGEAVSVHELIDQGRIGIWNQQQYMWSQQLLPTEEIGILPYPTGSNINQNITFSEGFMASSGTQNPNAAWKWIEFLSRNSTDSSMRIEPGMNNSRVPSRATLAQSLGYWESIDENTAKVYKWMIENQRPRASFVNQFNYSALFALMGVVSESLQNNNANITQLLRQAQSNFESEMANVQTTPTPTPDNNPVVVATPIIDQAPVGATTITFHSSSVDTVQLRRIARRFQQENPDVYIQFPNQNVLSNVSNLSELSKITDCFSWYEGPKSDSDFASLLNLQPLFDADATFSMDDYPRSVFGTFTHNGGIYGLPFSFGLQTYNYNRTAFDAIGIGKPNANWTADDILAAAQSLTQGSGDNKQYGYVSLQGLIYDLSFFANNHFNARLTTGSGEQARANFGDPSVVRAIQWYIDLYQTHQVMPAIALNYTSEGEYQPDPSWELVMQGRAGMWFGYGRMFGGEDNGFEEDITALPVGNSGLNPNMLNANAFYISSQSQNAQSCWKWLKFLSAETDSSFLQGNIPARTSVANSPAFTAQANADTIALYQQYSEILQREPKEGDNLSTLYSLDLYWLHKALDDTINRGANLEQALIQAQDTTNAYQDCLEQNGKPRKYATCANQVDPTYKGFNTEDESENPDIGIPRPMPVD